MNDIFLVKTGIPVFCITPLQTLWSDVVRHMSLKNVRIHGLNLLNFVYVAVFDVEIAVENAKLAILQKIELQTLFTSS